MKSFLVVLLLSILFFTFVSAQNDYCCPEHTDIPDIRTNEITQSLQRIQDQDCSSGGFAYTHTATLRDIEDDVDEVGACITSSADGCSDDGDYTWRDVSTVNNYTSVPLDNVERGDDRTLYVRAKNCAGYNTRSMSASDYSEPEIVDISASSLQCDDSDNTARITVTTSDVIVGNVEICYDDDNCEDASYVGGLSNQWTRDVDAPRGENINVKATATNCIGDHEMENSVPFAREVPDLGPVVDLVPITDDCAGYEVRAHVTQSIPSDTSVEACYNEDCKDIETAGAINAVSWGDDRISFDTEESDVKVTFNVSNCGGNEQTEITEDIPSGIKPEAEDTSVSGCPGTTESFEVQATMTSFWSSLNGDVEFCLEFDDGTECKDGSPTAGTRVYSATFDVEIGSQDDINGRVNASAECVGDAEDQFTVTLSEKSKPKAPDTEPSPQGDKYCTEDDSSTSYIVRFDSFPGSNGTYTFKYTIDDGNENEVDVEPASPGSTYDLQATVPEVDPESTVSYTITGYNCIGSAEQTGSFKRERREQLSIAEGDVSVSEIASESMECADTPERGVLLTIDNKGSGVDHVYCITDRDEGDDNCEWIDFTSTSGSQITTSDSVVIEDGSYDIHFGVRYSACEGSDYPLNATRTVPFDPTEVTTTIGDISIEEISNCEGQDCVPAKRFTVVNNFNEFLVTSQDNNLAVVKACFEESSDCGATTNMDWNEQDQVWQMDHKADDTDDSDFTFRAVPFYCGDEQENNAKTQETSIPAHQESDGSGFDVSVSLNDDSCEAEISFTQFNNFDSRIDTYRYCIGDDDGCLADRWFSTEEEDSTTTDVSGLPVSSFRVHAYPARCSGYFMDEMKSSDTASLPSQPQFEDNAEIEGEFNQADDNCNTYEISVSWPSLEDADKYEIVATANGQSVFSQEVTENSFETKQDISSLSGVEINFSVTAMKNCAGGERSTITATQTVPEPDCDGSETGTGDGGNGAAAASVSVLAVVFGLLAVLF